MQVVRFDSPGEVLAVQQNADGSVSATADVSRCGILEYRRADGTMRRELVLPEHLFAPESLRTLGGVAVTATPPTGHPPELVNPDNAEKYVSGNVHETVDAVEAPTEQDFGYVRVRFTGRTRQAINKLEQTKLFTSPGYVLPQYDSTPGIHPVWGPYDAIQGPRIYNHLALTDTPRGGSSMVVHLDAVDDFAEQVRTDPASWVQNERYWKKAKELAAEAGQAENYAYITGIYKQMGGRIGSDARTDSEATVTVKMRLDSIGRDVDVDPLVAEVLRQEFSRRDADEAKLEEENRSLADQYADAKSQYDAMKAKMDEMAAMMEKLKGEQQATAAKQAEDAARADAAEKRLADPAVLRQILAPRVALETVARDVLPKDQHARIDAMTDDEVRSATVAVLLPSLKLEGVKGAELAGMYRGALATRQTRTDARPPMRDPKAPNPQAHSGKSTAEIHQARTDAEYVAPGKGRTK